MLCFASIDPKLRKSGSKHSHLQQMVRRGDIYDELWASVMKAVPKLDESESSQMVLK